MNRDNLEFIGYDVFESSNDIVTLEYSNTSPINVNNSNESFAVATINEAKGASSNSVLGILEGVFFMPDGRSLNKRFYSETLWNNTLNAESVKQLLVRGMPGTFEHPNPKLHAPFGPDGNATFFHPINAGCVTKKLAIESLGGSKVGIGKSYVFDTPVGRVIDTFLRASDESGKRLFQVAVSSRAWSASKGKTKDGYTIMDPDNYYLEGFDVTLSPGIVEAFPKYLATESEHLTNLLKRDIINKDNEASESFLNIFQPKSNFLKTLTKISN